MEQDNFSEEVQGASQEPLLIIDANIREFLVETIKWGKFLAIVGFVFTGLIALVGIGLMSFGSTTMTQIYGVAGMGGFLGVIYLLMGLLYYFPSKYLYDFCVYTKKALQINDQESLVDAFSKIKSLYKFWGILMVVVIVFYGVALLFGIAAGLLAL